MLPAVYFWAELHSGPTNLVAHQYTAWNTSITNILFLAAICSLLFAVLPPIIVTALACVWRGLRLRWVYIALTVLGLAAYASLCLLPLLVPNERLFPLIRALTSRIGVFPFIGLFLLAIFSVAALSSIAFDTWRIPVFSLLVLTALVFSVMGLNSDFDVRLLGSGKTEMKPPPIVHRIPPMAQRPQGLHPVPRRQSAASLSRLSGGDGRRRSLCRLPFLLFPLAIVQELP